MERVDFVCRRTCDPDLAFEVRIAVEQRPIDGLVCRHDAGRRFGTRWPGEMEAIKSN